ncbi:MAG: nucleotide pyrophosphohydrolase [Betaproteobacteria bacterium HGW-Betaproteobacteria-11]|jgi:NTP pyrophosphatase (non-canonical NTP hydrolase)|nr:MAG: nucleotide pyrophosphohydrolase [Betaproteobacteria bacterium HGW-Betaproteobacteria-11]
MNEITDLGSLRDALHAFCAERDWPRYHTPKNLVMALIVEAAELVEQFQWLTPEESRSLSAGQRAAVTDEIADVLIYLTELADVLQIDMLAAARQKIVKNALKYPAGDQAVRQQNSQGDTGQA